MHKLDRGVQRVVRQLENNSLVMVVMAGGEEDEDGRDWQNMGAFVQIV